MEIITDYVFSSGTWGSYSSHMLSESVRDTKETGSTAKGKVKWVKDALFPSAKTLRHKYPCLENRPFLLPFVWVQRWIEVLLLRPEGIRNRKASLQHMTEQNISSRKSDFEYIGLPLWEATRK